MTRNHKGDWVLKEEVEGAVVADFYGWEVREGFPEEMTSPGKQVGVRSPAQAEGGREIHRQRKSVYNLAFADDFQPCHLSRLPVTEQ